MAGSKLFDNPFDDGTKLKLDIFKKYLEEWLPVFVARKNVIWKTVQIFDFFAGPGQDSSGQSGSPLLAIQVIETYINFIKEQKIKVILHLNELDPKSYAALRELVKGKGIDFEIRTYNKRFSEVFEEHYDSMKLTANFLFLDQNGIKEVTEDIFKKITELRQTDFLFFISSSFFKRFAKTPEFQRYFPFNPDDIEKTDYYHVHRMVLGHYKSLIPEDKEYYVAPFSIMKGTNIYGLIFGTNHTLGIEKFLQVAWKIDKIRGEANFNIDNEKIDPLKPSLFEEFDVPTKKQLFERNLEKGILDGQLCTNRDVYKFGLEEGFLPAEVNRVLKSLKKDNKIDFDFSPVSTDVHKVTISNIKIK